MVSIDFGVEICFCFLSLATYQLSLIYEDVRGHYWSGGPSVLSEQQPATHRRLRSQAWTQAAYTRPGKGTLILFFDFTNIIMRLKDEVVAMTEETRLPA